MRPTRITALVSLGVALVACGIDAVGAKPDDAVSDGGGPSTSSSTSSSSSSSGGGDDAGVEPTDAAVDVAADVVADTGPDVAPLVPPYLVLTHAPASGTIDLTAEGTTEWAYWGANGTFSSTRKVNVTNKISAIYYPAAVSPAVATGFGATFTWADGDPTTSGSGDWYSHYACIASDFFFVQAPSGLTKQTLVVWVGGANIRGKMTASFGDSSVTAVVDNTYSNLAGTFLAKYVLEFASLTVTTARLTWEPDVLAASGADLRFTAAALR